MSGTEQGAVRTIFSATLPKTRAMPVFPCVAITMSSAPLASASRTMAAAAEPLRIKLSPVAPALCIISVSRTRAGSR